MHSDPGLVGQILRNLLANAIKYTRSGRVTLRCLEADGCVRVQVLDTGIGIPAEHLPHIFEEFYQVGVPQNRSRDGFGLGLSIVERMAQLLDVPLTVDSEPERGTAFSFPLPVASTAPHAAPVRTAVPERTDGLPQDRRILLVEDDPGVREATVLLLKSLGCAVSAAGGLTEALERAPPGSTPDLLITDFHLGAHSGLDVIAALRLRFGPELGVILVSGDTSPAIRGLEPDRRMRLARKPIEADELVRLMSELLAVAEPA